MISLSQFGLAIKSTLVKPSSESYRPPSWPPPRDWVCVEDKNGNPVTRWGDPVWDLSPWTGKPTLVSFGDGPRLRPNSVVLDQENADNLRLLFTWKLWGPRASKVARSAISNWYDEIRKVIALASNNGISVRDLMKYPLVADQVLSVIAPSKHRYFISELDRLLDAKDILGFTLFDKPGIRRLQAASARNAGHEQTAYIPPRIWSYVVSRLKACLDDYVAHKDQVETCFRFAVEAYQRNYGENIEGARSCCRNPFWGVEIRNSTGEKSGLVFHGSFDRTLERFGIRELFRRWGSEELLASRGIQAFSAYMSLVQSAALNYIACFTLMRKEEVGSLQGGCLVWCDDEKLGRVPLICGETTKTDPDSDARWVGVPSLEIAVAAAKSIALLRAHCVEKDPDPSKVRLLGWASEPWSSGYKKARKHTAKGLAPHVEPICHQLVRFPLLFDPEEMRIRESDLKISRSVCPSLDATRFQIGKQWPLAWHQLRRTGAVNMFASGKISDSTIQFQLKHLSRAMTLYYGRGSSSLCFDEDTRVLLVNAQYEAMNRELSALSSDRFVSPYGEDQKAVLLEKIGASHVVSLISEKEVVKLEKAARNGHVSFRLTVLGACLKNGPCEGDCYESIADCAGGGDKSPCSHALFDKERREPNKRLLDGVHEQLAVVRPDTPRYRALMQERRGLENYFAYVNKA